MFLHLENVNPIVLGVVVSVICLVALTLLIVVFYLLVNRSRRSRVLSLTMHRKERGFVDGDRAHRSGRINAFENCKELSIDKNFSTSVIERKLAMNNHSPPPRILLTTPSLQDKEIPLNDIPIA